MTKEDIVEKFVIANVVPTRYTIQDVLGFSAQTLVRRGFSMLEIKEAYNLKTKKFNFCNCCGIEIPDNQKYCSRSCAATINGKLYPKRLRKARENDIVVKTRAFTFKSADTYLEQDCRYCKKTLINNQRKYCSVSCQHNYEYDLFINAWLAGEIQVSQKDGSVPSKIRKYLFKLHDSKCSCCGWGETNPTSGKVPLEVEHVDGNSQNNSPNNLTLLCPNCHSLTSTYKALNKGKGRHERMKRYRDGKSY
jgi:predicted nucleic acid-binding Zn ribbon protein